MFALVLHLEVFGTRKLFLFLCTCEFIPPSLFYANSVGRVIVVTIMGLAYEVLRN